MHTRYTDMRVGVVGAKNGTLSIMVGGSESAFNRALPVLQAMGTKVTYCGDLGAGLAAKIANKYVNLQINLTQCMSLICLPN